MKADSLKNIEKDNKAKKKYLPPYFWIRNVAIYPPVIFLFFALFGLVYLLNHDMLMSYYAIPFVLIFLLATIWLKRTRQILLKNLIQNKDTYKACLAKTVEEKDGWIYAVFTTDEKRHNRYFIENLGKNINPLLLNAEIWEESKKQAYKLPSDISPVSDNAFFKAFRKKEMAGRGVETFPVFYINERNILLIKPKDLDF